MSGRFYRDFAEVIHRHSTKNPSKNIFTFLNDKGRDAEQFTFNDLHEKAKTIAGFLQNHCKPGDRAILIYPSGCDFIYAFMGCLYSGVIAVPVFPPVSKGIKENLKHIVHNASPVIFLCDSLISSIIQDQGNTKKCNVIEENRYVTKRYMGLPLVSTENIGGEWATNYYKAALDHDSIAFLQYTSGSTGDPKGVIVTHGNLLNNSDDIRRSFGFSEKSKMAGWMPFFHDMGLIGNILQPFYVGFPTVLMSPETFVKDPLSWLDMITQYKATCSGGPNFAYELCIRRATKERIENLDLSSWDLAFNGAEPIRPSTLERFTSTFQSCGFKKKAFYPCYGLAESTLLVAGSEKLQGPMKIFVSRDALLNENKIVPCCHNDKESQIIISCGYGIKGQRLEIVDPHNLKIRKEGHVGEIWLKGPSVAAGYWKNDALTRAYFKAYLDNGDGPFFRTGDLGFIKNNELFITGRLKDLIIINGRNYYPQDIESSVERYHHDIRAGRVAAFSILNETEEQLCLLVEFKGDKENCGSVINEIKHKISREYGIKAAIIAIIEPKQLPVTTSGKIRRKAAKELFKNGEFKIFEISDMSDTQYHSSGFSDGLLSVDQKYLTNYITNLVAKKLHIEPEKIDATVPLGQYGLSSRNAVELSVEFEILTHKTFEPTTIFEYPTIEKITDFLTKQIQNQIQVKDTHNFNQNDIAIIGMACFFPGSSDPDSYWENIVNGSDLIGRVPLIRNDDKAIDSKFYCSGGTIEQMAFFDAEFFGIPPAEATVMDPQHRIFLETAWKAIEDSGYAPYSLSGGNTGVFAGVSSSDYRELSMGSLDSANAYSASGIIHSMLANRISYILDIHGPSEIVDTACSSSLVAVHRAVQAIQNKECDQAVAGGVNALLSSSSQETLDKAGILSRDCKCKTFDASANGYVRGEGAGAVVLKPVIKAVKDGDHIYAVIKGSAVNHGGKTISLTAPNENAQAAVIANAIKKAGFAVDTVAYIEAHGTGTYLGDPIEINGLKKAFNMLAHADEQKKNYCGIGSVKTNIGHLEAAAGIASLIKTVLAVKNKTIPASINLNKLNPYISLHDSPFYIVEKNKTWKPLTGKDGHSVPRRAGVSSFGFGGTNAHVVLEEYTDIRESLDEIFEPQAIVLSAKTAGALNRYLNSLNEFLKKDKETFLLSDIAFTLQTGREHFSERIAFIVNSIDDLKGVIGLLLSGEVDESRVVISHSVKTRTGSLDRIEQFLKEKNLTSLIRLWGEGFEIDWTVLHNNKKHKRVPLPTYQFEKTYYWIGETEIKRDVTAVSDQKDMAPLSVTHEEAVQWLKRAVSEYSGISLTAIDTENGFDECGINSIALIDMLARIKKDFHIELPETVLQNCPNISSMAHYIVYNEVPGFSDIEKDAILDDEIIPMKLAEQFSFQENISGKRILLTGATGFFGIFLLREFVNRTDAEIYCLVRAIDSNDGIKRLHDTMEKFMITDCRIEDRVTILTGDLTKKRFGIDVDAYEQLSQTIDTIYHCGAVVDWMKPYAILKKVNVSGTLEAIKFAGYRTVKSLHYISSLAVLSQTEGKHQWYETDISTPDNFTNGYSQSKWVAESLCMAAREKGLPVNIYRFDFVVGTQKTGAMKETDFIVRFIKGCIQSGCIPAEQTNLDIVSVDYLAQVVFDISKMNENKTYHLINRHPFTTSDFASLIRNFGYKLEKIPFDRWKKLIEKNPSNTLYPLYPFLNRYSLEDLEYYHKSTIDNTNTLTALYKIDPDLVCSSPSAEAVMRQVIFFFQKKGYLPVSCHERMLKRQGEYWQLQLAGAPMRLDLPKEKWVQKSGVIQINSESFVINNELFENIALLAYQMEISLPEVLLAVFNIFLFRYCNEVDIAVAVPVVRSVPVNNSSKNAHIAKIPIIRTLLPEHASFRAVLMEVKQSLSEAYANLDLPSDQIYRMIYPHSDSSEKQIYNCVFGYKDDYDSLKPNNRLNISPLSHDDVSIVFDGIALRFDRSRKSLIGSIDYDPYYFSKNTIVQMVRHFNNLLQAVISNIDVNVCKVPIMDKEEIDRILYEWNDTAADYPTEKCVHELFSMQAKMNPDAVAIDFHETHMTYKELDEKSGLLAGYLQNYGVGPGHVIGICIERCFNMMVGILGILKSGAAYVPLDPDYPETRLKFMVEDSGAKILLTQSNNKINLPELEGVRVLCLDEDPDDIFRKRNITGKTNFVNHYNASNLAYIIYTSGSTGNPKGVRVLHRSVVNMIYASDHYLQLNKEDVCLVMAPLCFDASIIELFIPLSKGAQTKYLPVGLEKNGELLKDFLDHNAISLMFATPTTWQMLKLAQWQGNAAMKLLTGGEAISEDLTKTLIHWGKVVYNCYGPTESTVCCTLEMLKPDEPVNIGRPFSNTKMYILDNYLNPLPIGARGELYIGSDYLAQGYHNLAELTESRFVMNPYNNGTERMYRTGDLARFLPDGKIVYLGRLDNQIKINGYRIELEEIQNIVEQDDQTGKCEVILREDGKNDKRIVVYIIPKNDTKYINITKIHENIKEKLPRFMIPSAYVVMEKFPLTPSGKTDINAFPPPQSYQSFKDYVPPSSTLEFQLAELWQKVLGIEKAGIHDDFLDIGGNSITSIKLLDEIRNRVGIDIKVQHLYENPTIAKLADAIEKIHYNTYQKTSTDNIVSDLIKDASFHIRYNPAKLNRASIVPTEVKKVFLTGATGFLGAYMLDRVLEKTHADVYCLVKAENVLDGLSRIKKNMRNYYLWKSYYSNRIKPVIGNLAKYQLGIDGESYTYLKKEIDVIYHSASVVNFFYPYKFLKKTNVDGTIGILKLASEEKIKPLFYTSTLGVFESVKYKNDYVVSEDDELPDPQGLFYGYSQSKWVAEKIVKAANEKGLPVTIFTLSEILGDSKTGASNIKDIYNTMIKAFVVSGAIPDLPLKLHGIPVDYVADTIVDISLNPEAINKKFNIVSPYPVTISQIRDFFISSGYNLSFVPFDIWVELFEKIAGKDAYLSSALPLVRNDVIQIQSKSYLELQSQINLSYSYDNVRKYIKNFKSRCPVLDVNLFCQYLKYLEGISYISKPESKLSTWS